MRTPLAKRWPFVLANLIGVIVAVLVSRTFWVQLVVFLVVEAVLLFRFAFGWPWSRILRYREPS